ncbi:MAG: hypothetical protein ACI8UC_001453, partial [Psychromonas sp.]
MDYANPTEENISLLDWLYPLNKDFKMSVLQIG